MEQTTTKIHVLQTKLSPETISELFSLIEHQENNPSLPVVFQYCNDVRDADVVITGMRMRQRLERHIEWAIAKEKAIVIPQWLFDSIEHKKLVPCGDYAALRDLHDDTVRNCPSRDASFYEKTPLSSLNKSSSSDDEPSSGLSYSSRYSCVRASPLICPNQALVVQLAVIRRSRELEGEDRSSLSYERAIAIIKAFPHAITMENLHTDVANLAWIGPKILSMVSEFLINGDIHESRTISTSERYQSLTSFTSIYGIGPTTARKLYALGLRTLEDLETHYSVSSSSGSADTNLAVMSEKTISALDSDEELDVVPVTGNGSIRLSLSLRHDFAQMISRHDAEKIERVIMCELGAILVGCTSTVVGGFRRGKDESNDVDIVITHPSLTIQRIGGGKETGVRELRSKLIHRLYERGLVTHVIHLANFHAPGTLRTKVRDAVSHVLTVFILPATTPGQRRVHRRVDLVFAAWEVYWNAVVGWTGSQMIQRDLRAWAKERGLKFDSNGTTHRRDSAILQARSEREVFSLLGLEWLPPTLRNADT